MQIKPIIKFAGKLSKFGSLENECEDQIFILPDVNKIAVADGASEGIYSKEWAEILVHSFCYQKSNILEINNLYDWISAAVESWSSFEKGIKLRNIPWFTYEKLKSGSSASFLGVSFHSDKLNDSQLFWQAVSCGDTCLFIVQKDILRDSFPIDESVAFGNNPHLIHTNSFHPYGLKKKNGSISQRDRIFVMTDALAYWFLSTYESGGNPWLELSNISTLEMFEKFVTSQRDNKSMKNDDVAIIIIDFE